MLALTGATGTLLTPRLDATAGNLCPGQRRLRTLPAVGQVVLYHIVHNRHIGFNTKNSFGKFDFADLFASHVINICLHNSNSPFYQRILAEAFCGFIRAEAFCGFVLVPASPFFSMIVFAVDLM